MKSVFDDSNNPRFDVPCSRRQILRGLLALPCLAILPNARAQTPLKRVALIIGNKDYQHIRSLINPVNDAQDMATLLKTAGFDVTVQYNRTDRQMTDDVEAFRAKLDGNTVALFYFSGHGIQIGGENYLLPVDFERGSPLQMKKGATRAEEVIANTACRLRILILDACRSDAEKGSGKGLNFMTASSGTLIAFSTSPGSTADDNPNGRNGLYTAHLLKEMRKPNLPLWEVFNNVSDTVSTASHDAQVPWSSSTRLPPFIFVQEGGVVIPTLTTLQVTTNAPDATIMVDGKPAPNGRYSLNLFNETEKTVEVSIEAANYISALYKTTLKRGETTDRLYTLRLKKYTLTTSMVLSDINGHISGIIAASFSPDGRKIVTGSWDKTAIVWDAITGKVSLYLKEHGDSVSSASFSPDGRKIVTGSWDMTAIVWDAITGEKLLTLNHGNMIHSASFSPDSRRVILGSLGSIKVWDAITSKEILPLNQYFGLFNSASFSPDGKYIVTSSNDKTAKVWDAITGKEILTLKGHSDSVSSATFSPDSKYIVTGSSDNTAKVWDATTGKEMLTLKGHTGLVRCVAFSLDGKYIVTGSSDYTARVWDATTGNEMITLTGHTNLVYSAVFSPDGTRIVTGSADNTIRVWSVIGEPASM